MNEPEIAPIQENVPPPKQEIPKPATSKVKRKRKSPEENSAQQKPIPTIMK